MMKFQYGGVMHRNNPEWVKWRYNQNIRGMDYGLGIVSDIFQSYWCAIGVQLVFYWYSIGILLAFYWHFIGIMAYVRVECFIMIWAVLGV
jgi:hypothetical protein